MIMHPIENQEDEVTFSRSVWEKEGGDVGDRLNINGEEREVLSVTKHRDRVTVRLQVPALSMAPSEIEALREELGMSQLQFAEAMGTGARTVRTWVSGRVVPSAPVRSMMRILRFINEKEMVGQWIRRSREGSQGHATSAEMIRSIRSAYGMSQRSFAIEIGIPQVTLIQWEQSRRAPTGAARALMTALLFLKEEELAEEWLARN